MNRLIFYCLMFGLKICFDQSILYLETYCLRSITGNKNLHLISNFITYSIDFDQLQVIPY